MTLIEEIEDEEIAYLPSNYQIVAWLSSTKFSHS